MDEIIEVTDVDADIPHRLTKQQHRMNATRKHGAPVGSDNFRDLIHLPESVQLQLCTVFVNGRISLKKFNQLAKRKRVLFMIRAAFQATVEKDANEVNLYDTWQDVCNAYPIATQDASMMQWYDIFLVSNLF